MGQFIPSNLIYLVQPPRRFLIAVFTLWFVLTHSKALASSRDETRLSEFIGPEGSEFVGSVPGSFGVSNGSLGYTVPIAVAPGRGGMAPDLSLSYSHNAPNGLAGLGWSLSGIASISRCPATYAQDGFVAGVSFDNKTRFCMNGQRLVPVRKANGDVGAEYRLEIDNYSYIQSIGGTKNHPSYWIVKTKAGQVMTFGKNDNAVVSTKSGKYSWSLNELNDTTGNNAVRFNYLKRDNALYLESASYAGGKVILGYEDRLDHLVTVLDGESLTIKLRLAKVDVYNALKRLKTYTFEYDSSGDARISKLQSIKECNYDGKCLKPSKFSWPENNEYVSTRYLGQKSGEVGYNGKLWPMDVDGDGDTDLVYEIKGTKRFYYLESTGSKYENRFWFHSNLSLPNDGEMFTMDVNGDGRSDMVFNQRGTQTYRAFINNANGTISERNMGNRAFDTSAVPHWSIDINNDGRQDLLYLGLKQEHNPDCDDFGYYHGFCSHWNTTHFYRALILQSNGQFKEQLWGETSDSRYNDVSRWLLDLNGDGLLDMLYATRRSKSFRAMINNGNGTATDKAWSARTYDVHYSSSSIWPMDANGDGLTDLVYRRKDSNEYRILRNTAQGFVDALWRSVFSTKAAYGGQHWPMDVNGDGYTDLVFADDDSADNRSYKVIISQGPSRYPVLRSWHTRQIARVGSNGMHLVMDQNGDGRDELVFRRSGTHHYYSIRSIGVKPNAINKIEDGNDNVTQINYAPLTDSKVYKKASSARHPKIDVQAPTYVVSKVTASDGVGGMRSTDYSYEGLVSYITRPGAQAYAKITESYDDTHKSVETRFYQSYPYTGMEHETKEYYGSQLINRSLTGVIDSSGYGGVRAPQRSKLQQWSYELGNSSYVKYIHTTYSEFDKYGNVGRIQQETIGGGETFTTITTSDYANDTTRWLLGRLQSSVVRHKYSGREDEVRRTAFSYHPVTGLLTSEAITDATGSRVLSKTSHSHDSYGNIVRTVSSAEGAENRISTASYDSQGREYRSCNANNECISKSYNDEGLPDTITDANGLVTTMQYDSLGRLVRETRPDKTFSVIATRYVSSGQCGRLAPHAKTCVLNFSAGAPGNIEQLDGLGRPVRMITEGFDGRKIYKDTEYNARGQMTRVSREYYEGEHIYWANTKYDGLSRVVSLDEPGPHGTRTEMRTTYNGLETSVSYGDKSLYKSQRINAIGQLVFVKEEKGVSTSFGYNSDGNLLWAKPSSGPEISIEYDEFGRKKATSDPSLGRWTYEYNGFGEIIKQVDAKGQVVTNKYDRLGRLVERSENEGISKWTYGTSSTSGAAVGALIKEQGPGISKSYTYDSLGRAISETTQIAGESFTTRTSYDNYSRPQLINYPGSDRFYIENAYNERGYLSAIGGSKSKAEPHDYSKLEPLISKALEVADDYLSEGDRLRTRAKYYSDTVEQFAEQDYISQGHYYYFTAQRDELSESVRKGEQLDGSFQLHLNHLKAEIETLTTLLNKRALSYETRAETLILLAEQTLAAADHRFEVASTLERSADVYSSFVDGTAFASSFAHSRYFIQYWRALDVDASGRISAEVYGNGIVNDYAYNDGTGQLQFVHSSLAAYEPIRHIEYEYDAYQNVTLRDDLVNEIREEFEYDRLDRLTSSRVRSELYQGAAFNHTQSQRYDDNGNITYKSDVGSYEYSSTKPYLLTKAGNKSYRYDNNGNMLSGDGRTISWTSYNKPTRITKDGRSATFSYGPDRARYKKVNHAGDTTLYIGSLYERLSTPSGRVDEKHYIYANGMVVAEHIVSTKNGRQTRYMHKDALGSIDTITDNFANVVDRRSFDAWGKQRDLPWEEDKLVLDPLYLSQLPFTNKGYTGHEHIEEVDLIHMNGRVYDATLGRFLSADVFIQDSTRHQNFNRYSYVLNNPLKYNDPSGHFFDKVVDLVTDLIDAVADVIGDYYGAVLGAINSNPVLSVVANAAACINPFSCVAYSVVSTYVATDGDFGAALKSGVITAATVGASTYIKAEVGTGLNEVGELVTKSVAHGAVGGVTTVAQGGKFGQGFASSFVTKLFAPSIAGSNGGSGGTALQKVTGAVIAGLVGGTASKIGGGKFANGARTALVQYLFNQVREFAQKGRVRPHDGEIVKRPDGRFSPLGEFRRNADGSPRPHVGVDYAGEVGDPIVAADAGRVSVVCPASSCTQSGNQVAIEHADGTFSRYFHLDSISVDQGTTVSAGQSIGTLGVTGNALNTPQPHLHFEVRQGSLTGTPIDPEAWLGN